MRNSKVAAVVAGLCLVGGTAIAAQPQETSGGGIGMNIQGTRDKQNKKIDPPTLNLKSNEGSTWPMIATLVIVGACLLAAIIPPKRGHQD